MATMQLENARSTRQRTGRSTVTNKRLVLGSEQWEIESIADVDIISRKKLLFHDWLKLNDRTIPNIIVGGICLLLGFFFAWLAAGTVGIMNGLLIALALLMYLIAFYFIWRTWILSLPDLYNLELTLQDPRARKASRKPPTPGRTPCRRVKSSRPYCRR